MTGQSNPEARAVFLAALEYGVSPIARANYSRMPTPFTPEEDRADTARAAEAYHVHTASKKPARSLVVSAAAILAEVTR